jgi:enoyl-CoA hydratase/carnithine racemase
MAKSVSPATRQPPLLRENRDAIAILTLNRPQQRNSLSEELIAHLRQEFDFIASDRTIRAVVIAAKGPDFCAGHDLKEITAFRESADRGRAHFARLMDNCAAMMMQITALPHPFIAGVLGTATAAGCQLVASCDLAVAGRQARFATPGVNIGLFCSTPMVALSRNIARKHAMEMLLTGEPISADHAADIGLINRVVPPGTELEQACILACRIASKPAPTVAVGKKAFYRQAEMDVAEAYAYAASVMVENMLSQEGVEGIGAFVEIRAPAWKRD